MLDLLSRMAPPELGGPIIACAIGWAGLHVGLVGPEVADRLIEKEYLPRCEADLAADHAVKVQRAEHHRLNIMAVRERIIATARQKQAKLLQERERLKKGADLLMSETPLGELFKAISPTGDIIGDLEALMPDITDIDLDALNLPQLPKPVAAYEPEVGKSKCANAAAHAAENARLGFAAYTGSLTMYRPASVSGFETAIRAELGTNSGDGS